MHTSLRTVSNKQNGHFRSLCARDRQDGLPALSTCIVVTKISWVFCVSPTSAAVGFVVSRVIGTSVRRRKGIESGNDFLETRLATTSGLSLAESSTSKPLDPLLTPESLSSCSFEKKLEVETSRRKSDYHTHAKDVNRRIAKRANGLPTCHPSFPSM